MLKICQEGDLRKEEMGLGVNGDIGKTLGPDDWICEYCNGINNINNFKCNKCGKCNEFIYEIYIQRICIHQIQIQENLTFFLRNQAWCSLDRPSQIRYSHV